MLQLVQRTGAPHRPSLTVVRVAQGRRQCHRWIERIQFLTHNTIR